MTTPWIHDGSAPGTPARDFAPHRPHLGPCRTAPDPAPETSDGDLVRLGPETRSAPGDGRRPEPSTSICQATRRSEGPTTAPERRFHALFNHPEVGILHLDRDARILDANPALAQVCGRARSELRGRFVGAVVTRFDVEAHEPSWRRLVRGQSGHYAMSVTLRLADGGGLTTRMSVSAIAGASGLPSGAFAVLGLAAAENGVPTPARAVPTPPEAAVLELLAAGRTIQQIASEVGLSRRGVDYRVGRLRHKLRLDGPDGCPATAAGLVARAYTLGLLRPQHWPPRVAIQNALDDDPDLSAS
jgi:PAS domain S-box-containing protein